MRTPFLQATLTLPRTSAVGVSKLIWPVYAAEKTVKGRLAWALSSQERVGQVLESLTTRVAPFVLRRYRMIHKGEFGRQINAAIPFLPNHELKKAWIAAGGMVNLPAQQVKGLELA